MQEEAAAFQERLTRIETLIDEIQAAANPAVQAGLEELVASLLDVHGLGLERLLGLLWESGEAGRAFIHERLARDEVVGNLLLLHDLHPLSLDARVAQALEKVKPYLASHQGNVEVVDIFDGVVRVRLQGSCEDCPASSMTLKYAIEDAILEAAPDVIAVEAIGLAKKETMPEAFIPLPLAGGDAGGNGRPAEGGWHEVGDLTSLAPRTLRAQQVAGRSVLFCRMGENIYAYGALCPACRRSLASAGLHGTALVCPSCQQSFDMIRAGRGLDQPDQSLEPFPLLVEQDQVRIALPG